MNTLNKVVVTVLIFLISIWVFNNLSAWGGISIAAGLTYYWVNKFIKGIE